MLLKSYWIGMLSLSKCDRRPKMRITWVQPKNPREKRELIKESSTIWRNSRSLRFKTRVKWSEATLQMAIFFWLFLKWWTNSRLFSQTMTISCSKTWRKKRPHPFLITTLLKKSKNKILEWMIHVVHSRFRDRKKRAKFRLRSTISKKWKYRGSLPRFSNFFKLWFHYRKQFSTIASLLRNLLRFFKNMRSITMRIWPCNRENLQSTWTRNKNGNPSLRSYLLTLNFQ